MNFINTIPYNKVFLRKVYLPKDQKSTNKYNICILWSKSKDTVVNLHNHQIIENPTTYPIYYIEPIYKDKIDTKIVNLNYRQTRKELYSNLLTKNIGLVGLTNIDMANGRNMFYDLFQYHNIYIENAKKSIPMKQKVTQYITYIASKVVNVPKTGYNYSCILIDINEWFNDSTKLSNTISSKIEPNPVLYIAYAMYKDPDILKSLGNIDIVLYSNTGCIRINPELIDDKTYNTFKRELNKLTTKIEVDSFINSIVDETETDDDESEVEARANTGVGAEVNKRGEDAKAKFVNNEDVIEDDDEQLITDVEQPEDEEEASPVEGIEVTDSDEYGDIVSAMADIRHARRAPRTEASIARDKELKSKQDTLVVNGKTIKECTTFTQEDKVIPETDVSSKVTTTNENMKTVKYANFDKAYNEKVMLKDTMNIITHLNDTTIPTFVRDIKVEDTSTPLTYKETYTISLEDSNRVRHTLKFDMPKFIDNSFLYIGGNKKIINRQIFMKPIVKTGPDEVQICSNYNKIFLRRVGRKMTAQMERFKKALSNDIKGVKVVYGDNLKANASYKTILEYDDMAKTYYSIKNSKIEVIFNQATIHQKLAGKALPDNTFCIGFYSDNTPILMDYTTERVGEDDLITFIIKNLGEEAQGLYDSASAGASKFMYSTATIMAKQVPVILLLGYCEGLSTVLRKGNIKHYFTDKRPMLNDRQGSVQFADGYLVFDRYPFENSLLLNALAYLPTKAYSYADFDNIDVYIDLFESLYKARNLANAFDTFYEFMIDPITKEVLSDLGYPTDFVSVVLCANAMLADNSYIPEINMSLYRIRSNEIVNALLYKEIANAYSRYRATSNNNHPVKISIPQNAVISALMKVNTVEDHSTLNPFYETTKTRIASTKGVSGVNLDESYTVDKRSYHKSMVGLIGVSTSPDGNVGISRHLTLEPSITSTRGYFDMKDAKDLTDANIFTPAELLTPGGITHDDSPRVAMASKQSTHIVPVDKASPVLISNGSEQIIQYNLSSDFVVVADEDGEIVENDPTTGIVVIKYKSGKVRAIDCNSRIAKNAASGFYVSSKLICNYKVGDKVKAKDVVASEEKFFSNDPIYGNRMNIGSLHKVAIMSAYNTFEDSSSITKKVSNNMATSVIMMKDTVIGKNADIDHIVKIGDVVEVGDVLVSYSTSYEDERMNEFLRTISDEQGDAIKDLSRKQLKSKYGGVVEDIKIYCSTELNELSPSLKSLVSKYYEKINKKKKLLDKYDNTKSVVKAGMLFTESAGKTEAGADGKIKGHEVDGILIEFYIRYHDVVGVGDKITRILVI